MQNHYFDCSDTEGEVSDLDWDKVGSTNRFPSFLHRYSTSKIALRLELNKSSDIRTSDLGVYVCRNYGTGKSIFLNITGGKLLLVADVSLILAGYFFQVLLQSTL